MDHPLQCGNAPYGCTKAAMGPDMYKYSQSTNKDLVSAPALDCYDR